MKPTGIDIRSKGSVINHLLSRLKSNRINQCRYLKLQDKGYWIAQCTKGWAEHQPLLPSASMTGYGGDEDAYSWPRCIDDCPHYQYIDNFVSSLENEPSIGNKVKSMYSRPPEIESTLSCPDAANHYVRITHNPPSIVKRIVDRCVSFWFSHWQWIVGTIITLGVLVVMVLSYIKQQP